jgi:hypothetical protein
MTKLLEEAIEKVRKLPEGNQNVAAELLLAVADRRLDIGAFAIPGLATELLFNVMAKRHEPVQLDDETRAAVREGLAQAKRGEFASDEEMAAFFARHKG